MNKLGSHRTRWKIQRSLLTELPGLGKPGALERRSYPPGQHGQARRKFSEYSLRLREKQKLMLNYALREEQLRRLVKRAQSGKSTAWMETLVSILESRVDNVVFRLGFAPSILAARQLVSHGKVLINGKRHTISSAQLKKGDQISLTESAYKNQVFQFSIQQPRLMLPDWLDHRTEGGHIVGVVKMAPDLSSIPFPFDSQLVTEYYSGV